MSPKKRRLPSVVNKTAGSTCVLDLPTGALRYFYILLQLTSGAAAARAVSDIIKEIRIKIDGRVVHRILAAQIDYLREFNGPGYSSFSVGNDPFLKMHFAEMWRRTAGGEDALAWAMGNIGTLQIEFDIQPTALNAELAFTGISSVDYVNGKLGDIVQVLNSTVPANGAGKFTLSTLPKDLPYYRIHCFTDKIDKATVTLNGNVEFELTKNESLADQSIDGLNPTSTVFTIPFDQRQRVGDFIDPRGASEFAIEFECAAGMVPFQMVVEQVGPHKPGAAA
ncbi:major capsid protein P2 [Coraliomargarita parva]|uniref:major capsid protein P2 n=1 Tax=Coraliomargarita parva TaxID=3014050 RepID=UPI0022B3D724|nr:major capsid protein P2 [Coraliomargarita parva]